MLLQKLVFNLKLKSMFICSYGYDLLHRRRVLGCYILYQVDWWVEIFFHPSLLNSIFPSVVALLGLMAGWLAGLQLTQQLLLDPYLMWCSMLYYGHSSISAVLSWL